jgi:hypothetical protein
MWSVEGRKGAWYLEGLYSHRKRCDDDGNVILYPTKVAAERARRELESQVTGVTYARGDAMVRRRRMKGGRFR